MSPLPTPPGSGTFGLLGGLMMPVALFLALRKTPPGAVKRLIQAGATSPETALKPSTAKISRTFELNGPKRTGVVIALPDGRCWVDVRRYQRRRWILAIVIALIVAALAEGIWLLLPLLHKSA